MQTNQTQGGPVNSPSPQRIERASHTRHLARKWTQEVISLGFTAVPDLLLKHMGSLGLSPTDLVLLLQLMRYWWDADTAPFPSKRTLAEAMGCSEKNVQKVIKSLEARGFVQRYQRRKGRDRSDSNIYALDRLVEILHRLALDEPRHPQQSVREENPPLSNLGTARLLPEQYETTRPL